MISWPKRSSDAELALAYQDPDCAPALREKVRLVRRRDHNGTDRVLVTNLMDREHVTPDDLFAVYRRHWGIENAFRDLKIRYECEDFDGTTPQRIQQEIDTLMMMFLLESLTEEVAIDLLPKDQRHHPDNPRTRRHNLAALGDRLSELLATSRGTKVPRCLLDILHRRMLALARRWGRICRPHACLCLCRSIYGRWRI